MATERDPAKNAKAITPSDTVGLAHPCRAIYVGTGGNITLTTRGGDTITLVGVTAGSVLPVDAEAVATSTTASNLVALW